jgi:hypothetical protein
MEERVARKIQGQVQPNSGATPFSFFKGDVRSELLLCECKTTKHASFTLLLRDLKEIEKLAKVAGKLPVFIIDFESQEEYVVLRSKDLFDGV